MDFAWMMKKTSVPDKSYTLRKLGKILHVSETTKNIIVKADFVPKIGTKVFDGEEGEIGVVFDVIGPVNSPYVSVKSASPYFKKNPGRTLFVLERKTRKFR